MKTIVAADLFAGAGGTSVALKQACEQLGRKVQLTAVNHWPVAVETHAANHPEAKHLCETLDHVDPRKAIPGGKLDVLCASPECLNHSNARGGKPCDDQSRATAWHVVRWADALRPRAILVENVREFTDWGPLSDKGRPIQRLKGKTFAAWVAALESLNYHVAWRLANAADYGGATTRTRFFLVATRGRKPHWPTPSHAERPTAELYGPTRKPWRAAREVIDWSIAGTPLAQRKRPLKPNTLRRIAEGIRRFWHLDPEPFLVRLRGTAPDQMASSAKSLGGPLPTLTGGGEHLAVCAPFFIGTGQPNARGSYVYDGRRPMPTITSADDHGVVSPFVLPPEGFYRGNAPRSVDDPVQTITSRGGGHLVAPGFLVPSNYGERPGQVPRVHSIDSPVPTVVGSNTHGLARPGFIVKYNGTATVCDPADPLDTITAKDRFGVLTSEVADVLFRMLQPHELAAAMGFPAGYIFTGTRGDRVKQIGNAVEVNKARAHLVELLLAL